MYGCKNRAPYPETRMVADLCVMQDGLTEISRKTSVPFVMSRECEYVKSEIGKADPKCAGCKWRTDEYPTSSGTGAPDQPLGSGAGMVGVRKGQGADAGIAGHGDERASASAEERARVEALWPSAQIYQPTEEK